MKRLLSLLVLLLVCSVCNTADLTFPMHHRLLNKAKHRHSLTAQSTHRRIIHHNMKYFKDTHNANHHLLSGQTYPLEETESAFTIGATIAGFHYDLTIDTGSSDIYIKGEHSRGVPGKRYVCGQWCIDNLPHYEIEYLDGKLETYAKNLEVKFGNHVFKESILVTYEVGKNFESSGGLVGLSFPSLAINPEPNFLQTLINNKIIAHYSFGVLLNAQQSKPSFITLGAYNNSLFSGDLFYFSLVSDEYYQIKIDGIVVGASDLLKIEQAILDTGNTCISIPRFFVDKVLNGLNFNSQNHCYFKVEKNVPMFSSLQCQITNFKTLPSIDIVIEGKKFTIQKQVYLQSCQKKQNKWYCLTYIESVQDRKLFLGDGFFNRYYTYFDIESKRVGIAKNKEELTLEHVLHSNYDFNIEDWTE